VSSSGIFPFFRLIGGNAGIMTPVFSSSPPSYSSWEDPRSYPAIKGLTIIKNVTFVNFGMGCHGAVNRILMTTPKYGDIIHPTKIENVHLQNVTEDGKVRTFRYIRRLKLLSSFWV